MGDGTKIEWTDATWNPVVGCKAVSPGCDHCYAARYASRNLSDTYRGLAENGVFNGTVRMLPERLDQPLRWKKPRRIFVNSMSDLFHPDVPDSFIEQVFDVMNRARQHTFQVLTKRPQAMARWADRWYPFGMAPNVWLGTSIESDSYTFRANYLRLVPESTRFLSLEPLLGPLPSLDLAGIDWVIVGGESGPGARPMRPRWVRDIRDRCIDAEVAFLFKQWGEYRTYLMTDGSLLTTRPGKKAAGRELDGRTWDEYPK